MSTNDIKTTVLETIACSTADIPIMEGLASQHTFQPGQVLFYAGHKPYGLFILARGEVETTYLVGGTKTVKPGTILGVSAFVNELPYSATALAFTECQVYFLSKGIYFRLKLEGHPVIDWLDKQIQIK